MAFEDIDDDMPMDKPADYYKDEYGICPHCKHKLSEEEMERKMCSKCLQQLSGETGVFTRKGSSECDLILGIIAKPIILAFAVFAVWIVCLCLAKFDISKSFEMTKLFFVLCYEIIMVILGIAILILLYLFVRKIFDLNYKAHVKQRARYNNDILHEMGKDREARKSRGRWYD